MTAPDTNLREPKNSDISDSRSDRSPAYLPPVVVLFLFYIAHPAETSANCEDQSKNENSARRSGRNAQSLGSPKSYFIVGMTNSAPALMPDGQRDVTVLVRVQNLIESEPC